MANLAEAEGRALRDVVRGEGRELRSTIGRAGLAMAMLVVSVFLLMAGGVFLAVGGFLWVEQHLGTAAAAGLVGLVLVILGSSFLWILRSRIRK